jgi:hypothetical protein
MKMSPGPVRTRAHGSLRASGHEAFDRLQPFWVALARFADFGGPVAGGQEASHVIRLSQRRRLGETQGLVLGVLPPPLVAFDLLDPSCSMSLGHAAVQVGQLLGVGGHSTQCLSELLSAELRQSPDRILVAAAKGIDIEFREKAQVAQGVLADQALGQQAAHGAQAVFLAHTLGHPGSPTLEMRQLVSCPTVGAQLEPFPVALVVPVTTVEQLGVGGQLTVLPAVLAVDGLLGVASHTWRLGWQDATSHLARFAAAVVHGTLLSGKVIAYALANLLWKKDLILEAMSALQATTMR